MDQQNNRKRKDLRQILKEPKLKHKIIQSSDGKLTVPNVKSLARKPGQRHRLETLAARTIPVTPKMTSKLR